MNQPSAAAPVPVPIPPPSAPAPRALTLRAVITGLICVVGIAILTPINDWRFGNTYFYSQHLPIGVSLLAVLLGVGLNPLLGSRRFRSGELMVIVGLLLTLGGVVSSGLTRLFPGNIAGPARELVGGTWMRPFVDERGEVQLPTQLYVGLPEHGLPDPNDPEYRHVVGGFHTGLGSGSAVGHRSTVRWRDADGEHVALAFSGPGAAEPGRLDLASPLGRALVGRAVGTVQGPTGPIEILAISAPDVPWAPWGRAFLAWLPLLASSFVAIVALAGVVRRQWIHNERLPFPIATVIAGFLDDPGPGRRLAPVFRQKLFWIAFAVVAGILLLKGLHAFGLTPFLIPTEVDLSKEFKGAPWDWVLFHRIWQWRIYFSIVAVTFLLPVDLAFSMWFSFVALNIVAVLTRSSGVQIRLDHASAAVMGGYAVAVVLILWVGRVYYLRLLKAAFTIPAPELREGAWYARFLLLGLAGMVASMTLLGARPEHALVAAGVYLGVVLVLARLVAESGIPFAQWPAWWTLPQVIFSITGFSVPVAALAPLALLGQTLMGDPRENVLPYAVNAEHLADRAGARRLPFSALQLTVLLVGTVIAGATLVWSAYTHDGMTTHNDYWSSSMKHGFQPIATAAGTGTTAGAAAETWISYSVGAVVTAVLGVCRLLLSWWPLHPLGFLISATYSTSMVWFSFFLGWLLKALVMRYGGMRLYRTLKPAAFGLIAAEAFIVGGFLVLGLFGILLPKDFRFLPA